MPFRIIRDDIARVSADAIVCSASPEPTSGGGAEAAIHKAAGPGLLRARKRLGRLEPGAAAVTRAYRLRARYVIHTVGPVWRDGSSGEVETLRRCYRNAISTALSMRCRSAAFPLISSGTFGFSKAEALRVALNEFQNFAGEDIELILVVYDQEAYTLSFQRSNDVAAYIDENYVSAHPGRDRRDAGSGFQASYDSMLSERSIRRPQADSLNLATWKLPDDEGAESALRSIEQADLSSACYFGVEPEEQARPSDAGRSTPAGAAQDDNAAPEEESAAGAVLSDIGASGAYEEWSDSEQAGVPSHGRALKDAQPPTVAASSAAAEYLGSAQPTAAASSAGPAAYLRSGRPTAPAMASPQAADLESRMKALDAGFSETLLRLIDESGCSDAEIYKRANVSRKLFSKIRSAPDYRPSKPTALAFCVALHMKPNEARDLLARAGYAISHSSRLDVIVEYFLETGNYDIIEINETLFCYDQPLLGSA